MFEKNVLSKEIKDALLESMLERDSPNTAKTSDQIKSLYGKSIRFTEDLLHLSNVDRVIWGMYATERPALNFMYGYEPVGTTIKTALMHELISGIRRLVLDEHKKGENKYSVPCLLNTMKTIIKYSKSHEPQIVDLYKNIGFIYHWSIRDNHLLSRIKEYADHNLSHSDIKSGHSQELVQKIRFDTMLIYHSLDEIMDHLFTFYLGSESCPKRNDTTTEQTFKLLSDLHRGKILGDKTKSNEVPPFIQTTISQS